jgi:hypothetical protein
LTPPKLSVILAETEDADPSPAIAAILTSCEGLPAEIILVGEALRVRPPDVSEHVPSPRGTLTPVRWGLGLAKARGDIVAFTTSELLVHPPGARKLLEAMTDRVAGAAGGIELWPGAGPAQCAMYLLRYSAFVPARPGPPIQVADIPGDTGAYRRSALLAHPDLLERGVWEIEFHRRFLRDGLLLMRLPESLATFAGKATFVASMQQRYEHGREFGRARVRHLGEAKARVVAAAPLVPMVLTVRALRRVAVRSLGRGRVLAAMIPLLLLSGAWALGEAIGALSDG